MTSLSLKGHSGCKLSLQSSNGLLVVVKTSKNMDYNERLKKQCDKQQNIKIGKLTAPKILNSGYNEDGLFYFLMEYVSGQTLAEYFKDVKISEIDKIASCFVSVIPEKFVADIEAKNIFDKKILELDTLLSKKSSIVKKALAILKKYDWNFCAHSSCHGDMTFENIILKDENIYLIDFLDSFYDSWMIDFAKLLQDVECGWSYRNDKNIDENLEIRMLIFKSIICNKILLLNNGRMILKTVYYMLLLNLIRIIPYSQDERTAHYLENNIEAVYNKIINF